MSNSHSTDVVTDIPPLCRYEIASSAASDKAYPAAMAIASTAATLISTPMPIVTRPLPVTLSTVQQNNNNNHKIEQSNHLPPPLVCDAPYTKMRSKGITKILVQILIDLCMLCCVALPTLVLSLWGEPRVSGFFCDDESLKHPYRDSTIRSWMLYLVCLVLPIALIIIIEFYASNDKDEILPKYNYSSSGYSLCHLELPDWLIESYKKVGILMFGCGVELLTTEIAKYSLGRLRPHFFSVCQPVMSDGTTCEDAINAQRYIENYSCSGRTDNAPKQLRDVNLSFPSGHASFTCFTMVYITHRMKWKRAKMLKHLMQLLFLLFAWYTALTRVSDYKHHWTDVLAGSCIGVTYAIIATSTLW